MSDPNTRETPPGPVYGSDAEEIRALFHRLWSRAATGDRTYDKAEWKRFAALLAARGIQT